MNVLIFGANGKTGQLAVEAALAKDHQVSVFVRNPSSFQQTGVRVLQGDATNASDVLNAMPGHDAVIDTIGGTTPYKATTLERDAANNIIAAMRTHSVKRLITVSMMGLGDSRQQAPFWYSALLMNTFLRGSTPDKAAMESAIFASGLDYIVVRPPILKDTPATGKTLVIGPGTAGHEITRADLANFLVDQLDSDRYLGHAVTVVNS